jgi:osmotically-inducible protein OsmY
MPSQRMPLATMNRPDPFGAIFQEITNLAQATLRRSAYVELRGLSCDFSGGILTLRGLVPSYYLKQHAQEIAASIPGVIKINNHVEVGSSDPVRADRRDEGTLALAREG